MGDKIPGAVHEALTGPGQPLEHAVRTAMELRFQHDFSAVRVHTDKSSSEATRAVGASAFTVGRHLVFGIDQYRPHSEMGQRLLAHELAHVVQSSSDGDQLPLRLGAPSDQAEHEAEAAAAGRPAAGTSRTGAHVLRRQAMIIPMHVPKDEVVVAASQKITAARQLLSDPRVTASTRARLEYEITTAEAALSRYRASHRPGLLGDPTALASSTTQPVSGIAIAGAAALIGLVTLLTNRHGTDKEAATALATALRRLAEAARPYTQESDPQTPPTAQDPGPPGPGRTSDLGPLVTAAAAAKALDLAEQTSHTCEGMKQSGLVDHECWELDEYPYEGPDLESARQRALKELGDLNKEADLDAYKEEVTTRGPCRGKGSHTNVRDRNGKVVRDPNGSDNYFGSIVCCPCCVEEPSGPAIEARCGLV
jgi:hypothetical protein